MATDARGWYWHEKVRIRAAWAVFLALQYGWFRPLNWLTRGRVWAHESGVWLKVASYCWLIDDLKADDLPEHERIGGIWS